MQISYRYEPEVCRFWIGAKENNKYQEFALQHWMDVEDVINILNECVKKLKT